jgi:hypothetical protein
MSEDIVLGSFTDFAVRPNPNGSGVDARIEFAGGERVQLTIPPDQIAAFTSGLLQAATRRSGASTLDEEFGPVLAPSRTRLTVGKGRTVLVLSFGSANIAVTFPEKTLRGIARAIDQHLGQP